MKCKTSSYAQPTSQIVRKPLLVLQSENKHNMKKLNRMTTTTKPNNKSPTLQLVKPFLCAYNFANSTHCLPHQYDA